MLFQGIEKRGSESKITRHEFSLLFRAIYTGQIEYKISLGAEFVQIIRRGVDVIFHHFIDSKVPITTGLAIAYIFKLGAKVASNKPFCPGYQYFHILYCNLIVLKRLSNASVCMR